ncbi:universal stress protein [Arcicella lustrica]|uniref:Universal stress protein n=1 Tax=Arcicella lustrica TaxID=2984196 RepID=A0ABU5SJM8_9BACT|nr:universal stress protein [Arcicella sp. DC25W]MEA5427463.1 universal stress protein [Arcicella sp. DC25W]
MENLSINNILVPIDYSKTSLNALDYVVNLSHNYQSTLHLLHIIDPDTYLSISENGLELDLSRESIIQREKRKLAKLADSIAEKEQLNVYFHCVVGEVVREIIHIAEQISADMIVMGTHGISGFKSFFMGTNAFEVSKKSSCPVLTIPTGKKWRNFEKVLFPVRTIPNALHKYEFAKKIIAKHQSELVILALLDNDSAKKTNYLDQELKTLNEKLIEDNIKGYSIFSYTDSLAYTALKKSDELEVDLMIITADFNYSIEDYFVGPFAQQVLNHAKIPILSIRPQESTLVTEKELVNENHDKQ